MKDAFLNLSLSQSTVNGHVAFGAAYGTAKSGIGIAGMGTFRPDLYVIDARPIRCQEYENANGI